jgi:hypothetical protein
MRILHIAPENFAGIPIRLVNTERSMGHDSRLISMMKSPQGYEEDICLELPLLRNSLVATLRTLFSSQTVIVSAKRKKSQLHYWKPSTFLQRLFHSFRDLLWEATVISTIERLGGLDSFDLIIADGGHDLFKVKEFITTSKTPVSSFYYGSDLRTRGAFEHIYVASKASFTFEFDHTLFDSTLNFLFFPFDTPKQQVIKKQSSEFIISHSPTNRKAKGTDRILEALEKLSLKYTFTVDLIEGVSYEESLHRKANSSLFIDQIGELGYGVSSLEALSLGVPTAVELLPDFEEALGEHPFFVLRGESLVEDLDRIIQTVQNDEYLSENGVEWVRNVHSTHSVVTKYLQKINDVLSV